MARKKKRAAPVRLKPLIRHNSNQYDDERLWYDKPKARRGHSSMRVISTPTIVYLQPSDHTTNWAYHDSKRHHRRKRWEARRSSWSSSSNSSSSSYTSEDERHSLEKYYTRDMKTQRFHSLQAMARLQRQAACIIQREYRFYRTRCRNYQRRQRHLGIQATHILDQLFLMDIISSIVSDALLEILRGKRDEQHTMASIANDMLDAFMFEAMRESLRDVLRGVLQGMISKYMTTRIDISRAASAPSTTVAQDLVDDWIKELLVDLLPEILNEMVTEYLTWRRDHDQQSDNTMEQVAQGSNQG